MTRPLVVALVQQGAWGTALESMPLAAGYLKAAALADPELESATEIDIVNFVGGESLVTMAARLFADRPPDVLGFSVLGWNQRSFAALAETYRQVRPDGLVVVGGNHVSNQGHRVLARQPAVDIVVNGEGEQTFRELLTWRVRRGAWADLSAINGISYRRSGPSDRSTELGIRSAAIHTTTDRDRIERLDDLPSPFLTGAIDLHDERGRFRYDVALMETNRGCPYKCAFCYWGGDVGSRVREFSTSRLRAEVDHLADHGAESIVLCDANFGMRAKDLEFVETLLDVRTERGLPRYLESSWTKNKSPVFYDIVRLMKREGLTSSFTLALQTLDDEVLATMNRRNMRINEWEDVAAFLRAEDLECYAELIWGAPGETRRSFYEGYDRLARQVPRIAVYPMLLIPNTTYHERRDEFGLVTVSGDRDDFDYVLAHPDMSVADNDEVQRFMFWARLVAEHGLLRWCLRAATALAGIGQSETIRRFAAWVAASERPLAASLLDAYRPFGDTSAVAVALRRFAADDAGAWELLSEWWEADIVATVPEHAAFLRDVLLFDWSTRPIFVERDAPEPFEIDDLDGERHYRRPELTLGHDVPAALSGWPDRPVRPVGAPCRFEIRSKVGYVDHVENQEMAFHYVGRWVATEAAGTL